METTVDSFVSVRSAAVGATVAFVVLELEDFPAWNLPPILLRRDDDTERGSVFFT